MNPVDFYDYALLKAKLEDQQRLNVDLALSIVKIQELCLKLASRLKQRGRVIPLSDAEVIVLKEYQQWRGEK